MSVIAIDIGGTKIAAGFFRPNGEIVDRSIQPVGSRHGKEVGEIIREQIMQFISGSRSKETEITSIGISVPGIYRKSKGTVWAPNINEWDDYPLLDEIKSLKIIDPEYIHIESDRTCYILGEIWKGCARGCRNAVFIAVGTGIGAGIITDGRIVNGQAGIAGAIGWMALDRPFKRKYRSCGNFEYYASGNGLVRASQDMLKENKEYRSILRKKPPTQITTHDIFAAYEAGDKIAQAVMKNAISFWGMAAANLISIFNPEIIVFGGGVFGPAKIFLEQIKTEAKYWAQPISMNQVRFEVSILGGDIGLLGAAYRALSFDERTK